MSMEQILETVRTFDGVVELAPDADSGLHQIAWGDHFFYYSPDGVMPERQQPYATIVTKNYPDDTLCDLDAPDRWRLNIHVGATASIELTGGSATASAYADSDVVLPHPVYGAQGWVCIVNPATKTYSLAVQLLHAAHGDAKRRTLRRSASAD